VGKAAAEPACWAWIAVEEGIVDKVSREVGFNRMGFARIEPEVRHETTKGRKGLLPPWPDVRHFVFSSFRTFVIFGQRRSELNEVEPLRGRGATSNRVFGIFRRPEVCSLNRSRILSRWPLGQGQIIQSLP